MGSCINPNLHLKNIEPFISETNQIPYSNTLKGKILTLLNGARGNSIKYYPKLFDFFSVIYPFLRVSSPFNSLDWGLTPVRVTASYLSEGLTIANTQFILTSLLIYPLVLG